MWHTFDPYQLNLFEWTRFTWPSTTSRDQTLPYSPHILVKEFETKESLYLSHSNQEEASFPQTKKVSSNAQRKRRQKRKERLLRKKERQDNFERKKQKKDRNLPSNVGKCFFIHLYTYVDIKNTLPGPKQLVKSIDVHNFIATLKTIAKETQSYIRPLVLQNLFWGHKLSNNERTAFRLLLKRFLLTELAVVMGGMPKYKRKQKLDLIRQGRKLFEDVKGHIFK